MGLAQEEPGDDQDNAEPSTFYLWPDSIQTFIVWQNLRTQWSFAPNGRASGMDYTAVIAYLDLFIPEIDTRRDIFTGLQAMECATLEAIATKQVQ